MTVVVGGWWVGGGANGGFKCMIIACRKFGFATLSAGSVG